MSKTPDHPDTDEIVRHARFLGRLAASLVGDVHLGEDIAQDVMAIALSRPPAGARNLGAWLAGLVRNRARRWIPPTAVDADGPFRLSVDPPRPENYQELGLQLGARFLPAEGQWVASGASDLRIVLPGGATIRGTFVDADGRALADEWIRAVPAGDGLAPGTPPGARTDATGAFEIAGLPPGRYRLQQVMNRALGRGGRSSFLPVGGQTEVAAGASGVRIVAGGPAPVTGVVVGGGGNPVAGARVEAWSGRGPFGRARGPPDGTFSLPDIGRISDVGIRADKPGYLLSTAGRVRAGASGVRIVLERGLTLTGQLTDSAGKPLAKTTLRLTHTERDHVTGVPVGEDGRFSVSGLYGGDYRVQAMRRVVKDGSMGRDGGTVRAGRKNVSIRAGD